jgi:hypothetical protein
MTDPYKQAKHNYYLRNKELCNARARDYEARHRDKANARLTKWRKLNPSRHASIVAQRNASKLKATPKWANRFFIDEIYHLASLRTKYLGKKFHVDHIVPLKSPLVCGLHTEHNLRIILGNDNSSKGNRHWPDMP